MRIYIRRTQRQGRRSKYPLKPTSFLLSTAIHGSIVAALLLAPASRPDPKANRPLYETEIKPNEKKIVWYNFRQAIPNLPATKKIGDTKNPQGKVVSPQIAIATSKDAKSKQFIWQPTPEKIIQQEIKAPNLVAVKPANPSPPPPPPPDPVKKAEEGPAVVKAPPREYQPPPQVRASIAPQPPPPIAAPPPMASVLGGTPPAPDVPMTTLSQLKIPPRHYVPPNTTRRADGVGSAKPGMITAPAPELSDVANVNIAIVGLNPSNLPLPAIPAGSLPGHFSTAPKAGKASTGNLPTNPAGVPNLVVEGGMHVRSGAAEPPKIPDARKTVLYRQVATGPMPSTLSAPLRPGTRTIPGALEARFRGINVYTMVLPAPKLPGYAGDWVLWFADRQAGVENTVQMRAPVPLRKKISDQANAPSSSSVVRVQVAGLVGKDGRLAQLSILRGAGPGIANAVLEDLKTWEFTPATRNMVPVDVEVVLEIPFRLDVRAER